MREKPEAEGRRRRRRRGRRTGVEEGIMTKRDRDTRDGTTRGGRTSGAPPAERSVGRGYGMEFFNICVCLVVG